MMICFFRNASKVERSVQRYRW